MISRRGALVALAFFAVSKYLIEFGDFVRPYSSDVLIALGLFALALGVDEDKAPFRRYVLLAVVGSVAVWLSFPSVFILAGVGLSQLAPAARFRKWRRLGGLSAAYGVCALSFLGLYLVSLRPIAADTDTMVLMDEYYQYAGAFMPLPPRSFMWRGKT